MKSTVIEISNSLNPPTEALKIRQTNSAIFKFNLHSRNMET